MQEKQRVERLETLQMEKREADTSMHVCIGS